MADVITALIVGAGPAGLAIAACLSKLGIPYVVLEREECSASLWRKKTYDRLSLHLAKFFCELPHMPYPACYPKFIPKELFLSYLDTYIERFQISPMYRTTVESAVYNDASKCWHIKASDANTNELVEYAARFLVVATGENDTGHIPEIPGLESFPGEFIHSSSYKSGAKYSGKSVLIVGCGNSGMEIAYDLANHGAKTSIVIRSPLHVMTKWFIQLGMTLAQYLPVSWVDSILVMLAKVKFGNLSPYGIVRPDLGPLTLKARTGRSAVIDIGTIALIKKGVIRVLGPVSEIEGNMVQFKDGKSCYFDVIVFATGYRSTAHTWLKDGQSLMKEDGMPKKNYPNHWKGANGLYCTGFARRGLAGIAEDAKKISIDIKATMNSVPF